MQVLNEWQVYQKRSLASSLAASCLAVVMSSRAVTAWTVSLAVCFCQPHVNSKLLHMKAGQPLFHNLMLKGQSGAEGQHTAGQAAAEREACQPTAETGQTTDDERLTAERQPTAERAAFCLRAACYYLRAAYSWKGHLATAREPDCCAVRTARRAPTVQT